MKLMHFQSLFLNLSSTASPQTMVFSTKSLAEAENKEFVQIPTGTHSTKPSHLNHEDLLPNLNDRLQKSIEDLVEIVSEEKTTHQPATTG